MSRTRFYVFGFGALMLFDSWTQICFKLAAGRTGEFSMTFAWLSGALSTPWIYGAIAGYLCAFVTWMTLLKRAPVGPAFAASHLEVVSVLILSRILFGEHISMMQVVGAACIACGIVFLSFSESRHPAGR